MNVESVYDIALLLGRALEHAGIDYMLTGSLVSGLHGHPRTTNDIDLVVHLRRSAVPALVEALGPDFDVDAESLADAAEHKRSWNIFHVPTATRIDLFVLKDDEYAVEAFFRRVKWTIGEGQTLHVMSAEDTVLQKLLWFRAGGEQSERQLRDVADVLRVQSGRLDERYLETWARKLGLEGLLARARGVAD